jgi:hypothetical protein
VACQVPRHKLRTFALAAAFAAAQVLFTAASVAESEFATPGEAKTLLEKAVVAMKQDEAKALELFASGTADFGSKTSMFGAPTLRTGS